MREIERLRRFYGEVQGQHPFETIAICILPDHLHAVLSLPEGDSDFATCWNSLKGGFFARPARRIEITQQTGETRERNLAMPLLGTAIRDETDLARHVDYIHSNPVKHGLVTRIGDWPYSSSHQYVKRGDLPADWAGDARDLPDASFGFGE